MCFDLNRPITTDMAEVLGVLLGDGCRSRFGTNRGTVELVAFTGNSREVGYYTDFIQKVIKREFRVSGYLRLGSDSTVRYFVQSKELNAFLDELAIPVGKRRDAEIPQVIRNDVTLQKPFIRGFYHAEGSLYRRYSKRYRGHPRLYDNLLVIQFRTKLRTLMTQLHLMVNSIGVSTTVLGEADGVFTFRITSQLEIERFIEIIRPRYKTKPRTA